LTAVSRFLRDLKDKCLNSMPGNREFWSEVQGMGTKDGLITSPEAEKFGGSSEVSKDEAVKVSARFVPMWSSVF
jgi:hypothetical protein